MQPVPDGEATPARRRFLIWLVPVLALGALAARNEQQKRERMRRKPREEAEEPGD